MCSLDGQPIHTTKEGLKQADKDRFTASTSSPDETAPRPSKRANNTHCSIGSTYNRFDTDELREDHVVVLQQSDTSRVPHVETNESVKGGKRNGRSQRRP